MNELDRNEKKKRLKISSPVGSNREFDGTIETHLSNAYVAQRNDSSSRIRIQDNTIQRSLLFLPMTIERSHHVLHIYE